MPRGIAVRGASRRRARGLGGAGEVVEIDASFLGKRVDIAHPPARDFPATLPAGNRGRREVQRVGNLHGPAKCVYDLGCFRHAQDNYDNRNMMAS